VPKAVGWVELEGGGRGGARLKWAVQNKSTVMSYESTTAACRCQTQQKLRSYAGRCSRHIPRSYLVCSTLLGC